MRATSMHHDLKTMQPIHLANGRTLTFERTKVMGIVNVTPDSFSDGGKFLAVDHAVGHALKLIEEGADIIDIGGESTRPGAASVAASDELARVLPVVEELRRQTDVPISVDTYKAEVARQVLRAGADMINDISALRMDSDIVEAVAASGAPAVLMHMQGTPQTMQVNPSYDNCVAEVTAFFEERIDFCRTHGISTDKLILDPGIGFGKRLQDNLDLLAHLERIGQLGRPVMIGVSRKSFIDAVGARHVDPSQRLGGSLAGAAVAVLHGARIVRVHDVAATVQAVRLVEAVAGRL